MKKLLLFTVPFVTLLAMSCGNNKEQKQAATATEKALAESKKAFRAIEDLNNDYREIPDEKMLENGGQNSAIYGEMKKRYKTQLAEFKQEVESTGAKFIVVIITPEVGPGITNRTRYGHPFIKSCCVELGIEYYDLSPAIAVQNPDVITQAPKDGHWSKKGAIFLADQLDPIIKKYADYRTKTTYKESERTETFGDLAPGSDEILDGGKNLPYRVVANAQGLRMNEDVKFPKTKQHVLFMGGSQIYSPFLDNDFITTTLLAKRHPELVIMNSGMISGCTDDFLSMWKEKAKYSEPDVVIVQTNGTDITDLFFTNRNHLARSKQPYNPSAEEEKYFRNTYRK